MRKNNKQGFLIVGLGSMGKRRIRNLQFNGEYRIIGYNRSSERRAEAEEKYGIKTVADINNIPKDDFDAVLICTAPDAHGEYIRFALKNKKHIFVEHPTNMDGYDEVFLDKKLIKAPSCTLRFYRPVKMIKEILKRRTIGKILAFQYHMGQYLPDWHPWEDYREVYFSKKETGACREMFAFELIWINWLIGSEVETVSGVVDKVSDLKMDADDISVSNLKYKNGILGSVIIDVISRKPFRTLRVLGSNGVLEWERFESVIKVYSSKTKKTSIIKVPKGHPEKGYVNEEEMYNDEIKTFLDAIKGKRKYPYTFNQSARHLKVLYGLEKSSLTGRSVTLKQGDKKN
jgi:predicted dehydrogenase